MVNDSIYQIVHAEGRAVPNDSSWLLEFNYTDHLGNLRLAFRDSLAPAVSGVFAPPVITQINAYTDFGMPLKGLDYKANAQSNKFKFNGIEYNEITGTYDAFYRNLDPKIGRWWQNDPKPNHLMSLYVGMNNNPIRYIDPLGDTIFVNKTGYVIRNDKKDNFVFMQSDDGKMTSLGELGKKINVNVVYKNLLAQNMKEAKGIYNPFTFKSLVKARGEWDLKVNKKTIFGLGNDGKTQFLFRGKSLEAQDIGNHHFGAVASAFGFPQDFALKEAGTAQMNSGTSKREWQIYGSQQVIGSTFEGPIYTRPMLPPYGDDPRDQSFIKQGYQYHNERENQ